MKMKADKRFHLIAIVFLSLLAILLYSNSLKNTFIFDDFPNIVNNPYIQNLKDISTVLQGLRTFTNWFRALPTFSFAINYHFNRINVVGYHIVNLVIHILSGMLVYFISRHLFALEMGKRGMLSDHEENAHFQRTDLYSLFVAALFISHPIQVNAVSYIVQRYEGLSSFFYLLSLFLFIRMSLSEGPSKKLYLLGTGVAFLFAIFSKETGFTLPIILILFDLLFICESWRRVKKRLMLYSAIGLPLVLFIVLSLRGGLVDILFRQSHPWTPWENLLTQSNVIIQYFKLIILPLPKWLSVDHDFKVFKSLFQYPTYLSISIILCLFILAFSLMKKSKLISFSIFFFFIFLSPTSSLIPILDIMVEYRLYLPIFCYGLILTTGLHYLYNFLAQHYHQRWGYAILSCISIILLSFYSITTIERNRVFKDEASLWSDAAKKSPNKTRLKINLIMAYHRYGFYDKAIAASLEELKKDPNNHEMHTKLGISYMMKGDYDKAIEEFRTSIQIEGNNPKAYNNLGVIYSTKKKDFAQAVSLLRQAISLSPNYAEAFNNLAKALAGEGFLDEAIKEQQEAIRLDPSMGEYHFNLAKLYENRGLLNESVKEYKAALDRDQEFFEAYMNLGMVQTKMGNDKEAIAAFERAIRINPNSGKSYFMLGINYIKAENREKAEWNLEKALQYASDERDRKGIEYLLNKLRSVSR